MPPKTGAPKPEGASAFGKKRSAHIFLNLSGRAVEVGLRRCAISITPCSLMFFWAPEVKQVPNSWHAVTQDSRVDYPAAGHYKLKPTVGRGMSGVEGGGTQPQQPSPPRKDATLGKRGAPEAPRNSGILAP